MGMPVPWKSVFILKWPQIFRGPPMPYNLLSQIDVLVQERRNSRVVAMELRSSLITQWFIANWASSHCLNQWWLLLNLFLMPYGIRHLGPHWSWHRLVACLVQSYYPNQCWQFVNWTIGANSVKFESKYINICFKMFAKRQAFSSGLTVLLRQ